ncbi:MAG: hypothetical protein BZ151_12610 [Desulfobacca sp. 4484_104]|nr:MAG: hypothetical protein BZ151_12610 [Desulfobacca sp. 4484_104]
MLMLSKAGKALIGSVVVLTLALSIGGVASAYPYMVDGNQVKIYDGTDLISYDFNVIKWEQEEPNKQCLCKMLSFRALQTLSYMFPDSGETF